MTFEKLGKLATAQVAATLAAVFSLLVLPFVSASPIVGTTFTVGSDPGAQGTGTHFHSDSNAYIFGPGFAEVGSFETEEVRGLSEFDATGQSAATAVSLTFTTQGYGLFGGFNKFPFDGQIDIVAYAGNNLEEVSDYAASATASIGNFSTTGLTIGTPFSFDITSILNNAIANNWTALGVRLSTENTSVNGGAWTFDNFQLVAINNAASDSTSIPEPSLFLLFISGLASLCLFRSAPRLRLRKLSPVLSVN